MARIELVFLSYLLLLPIKVLGQSKTGAQIEIVAKVTGKPLGLNPQIFRRNGNLYYLLNDSIYLINNESLASSKVETFSKKKQNILAVLHKDKLVSSFADAGKRHFNVDCGIGKTTYHVPSVISDDVLKKGVYAESNGKFIFCANRNFWILERGIARKILLVKINNWTSQQPNQILIHNNYAYLLYGAGGFGGALTRIDLKSAREEILFEDRMLSVTDMVMAKGSLWFTCARAHLGPGNGTLHKLEKEKITLVASTGAKDFDREKNIFFWATSISWSGESTPFNKLFLTPEGKILVENGENELLCWDDGRFEKVAFNKKLDRKIYSLYFDNKKSVYVVSGNDIFKAILP